MTWESFFGTMNSQNWVIYLIICANLLARIVIHHCFLTIASVEMPPFVTNYWYWVLDFYFLASIANDILSSVFERIVWRLAAQKIAQINSSGTSLPQKNSVIRYRLCLVTHRSSVGYKWFAKLWYNLTKNFVSGFSHEIAQCLPCVL